MLYDVKVIDAARHELRSSDVLPDDGHAHLERNAAAHELAEISEDVPAICSGRSH